MKKSELIFDPSFNGSLKIKHISKLFGNNFETIAINDVSLQIFMGQFVVVLGASGSGKTTLLNLIGGIDDVSYGEIEYAGIDITKLPEKTLARYRKEVVGYVFQSYNLLPNLTAYENVKIAEVPYGSTTETMLEKVQMKDKMDYYPAELSGGEQQRVALARAFIKNPKILLCDEPTGALDKDNSGKVLTLLKNLNKDKNNIVIVVTHNTAIAELADRVIKLSDGKIVSDILQKNPKNVSEIEL